MAAAQRKRWRSLARDCAILNGRPALPLKTASIVLTRYSSVEPDYDNLVISFKPIIDGLRDAGVITDDRISVIGRPSYRWKKAPKKLGKVRIEICG